MGDGDVHSSCDGKGVLARRPEQWRDVHPGVRWPGDVAEFMRLLDCVGRHCTCQTARECGAHQLLGAQRTLDHLVYARSVRQQFVDSEWNVGDDGPRPGGKVALVAETVLTGSLRL